MYLTKYGMREWLGSAVVVMVLVVALLCFVSYLNAAFFYVIIFLLMTVWLCIAAFFRDPERKINSDACSLVSPADGVVRDIEIIRNTEENTVFGGCEVIRIGIFLSVFNVHINRAPCHITVNKVVYKPGRFYDARDGRAIKENESNAIVCTGDVNGRKFGVMVKQISGAIARRIVCPVKEGDKFQKGQRYGMIKFGSRTEVYLPVCDYVKVAVQVGDKVKAGMSVIAQVR